VLYLLPPELMQPVETQSWMLGWMLPSLKRVV
jgi:hypothetical protein